MRAVATGDFYATVDGDMCWPRPESMRLAEISWNLIHAPDLISDNDKLVIASVISAYSSLILEKTQKSRNEICSALKDIKTTKGE